MGRMTTDMATDIAHKHWWQSFEVFLAVLVLQLAVPLSFPARALRHSFIIGSATLVIVGATLIVSARRALAQQGQPTDPGRPTSSLVTTGVFAVSRNPLYLGGVCILAGIALAFNLPWLLALLPPAIIACHYVLIAPEERYLAAKFGKEYEVYAASVRRWMGRI